MSLSKSVRRDLVVLIFAFCLLPGAMLAPAQSGRSRGGVIRTQAATPTPPDKPNSRPTATPTPDANERTQDQATQDALIPLPADADLADDERVTVDTTLVAVPVVARDRDDRYIPGLQKEDFAIYEDGALQDIAFFATTSEPFHVVLLLDTSGSTQDKLREIKNAAYLFTAQLQPQDRVKIISFDDAVHDLTQFTSDREELKNGINRARSGNGTQLYDAMALAITVLNRIKGRKAIVIFTDGVDTTSQKSSYNKNKRALEEAGIIAYPIRYDTRADLEAQLAQQNASGGALGTILGLPSSIPTTFPSGGGGTTRPPQMPQRAPGTIGLPGGGTIGLPLPYPRTGGSNRYPDPNDPRNTGRYPDPNDPRNQRYPNPNDPNDPRNNPNGGSSRYPNGGNRYPSNGGLSSADIAELDHLYAIGDAYLRDLAETTGGALMRADTLGMLPAAFDQIAAELRTQYTLGYYPKDTARDGKFRKIKVKSQRKNVVVRARPGYRAPGATTVVPAANNRAGSPFVAARQK